MGVAESLRRHAADDQCAVCRGGARLHPIVAQLLPRRAGYLPHDLIGVAAQRNPAFSRTAVTNSLQLAAFAGTGRASRHTSIISSGLGMLSFGGSAIVTDILTEAHPAIEAHLPRSAPTRHLSQERVELTPSRIGSTFERHFGEREASCSREAARDRQSASFAHWRFCCRRRN